MADRKPRRKSSLSVTLVLIGTAALAGCDDGPDNGPAYARRDTYASLEDCQKDWGRSEQCEPAAGSVSQGSSGTHGGSGSSGYVRYYGPWYGDASPSTGPRPGSHANGSMSVSRGGFGSTAGLHSSAS
jgi:uncharacterized protein YgiB involved in biofilm formation